MEGRWLLVRRYGLDVLLGLLVATTAVEVALRPDLAPSWPALALVGTMVVPLLVRHRFPFAAPAAYWVLAAAMSLVDPLLVPSLNGLYLIGMVAAYLLGNLPDVRRAVAGVAIVACGAVMIALRLPEFQPALLLSIPLPFIAAWGAGVILRNRSTRTRAAELRALRAEADRDAAARVAVAEERARIARELHDIVAHSVSVMVLQVGAVRHGLAPTQADDRDALREVEQTGRAALNQMRQLLAAIRPDEDKAELSPEPGVADLPRLIEQFAAAGLPVEYRIVGDPHRVPPSVGLSAYRITQEALTNVLKHAHATQAWIRVEIRPDAVTVDVVDDGVGPTPSDGMGHGLIGMRERVKIYGGEVAIGPRDGGGYRVRAQLPISGGRQ